MDDEHTIKTLCRDLGLYQVGGEYEIEPKHILTIKAFSRELSRNIVRVIESVPLGYRTEEEHRSLEAFVNRVIVAIRTGKVPAND